MTARFEWDPTKYSVGVAEMDAEHRVLVGNVVTFQTSGKLTEELFTFLHVWLKSHICASTHNTVR